MLLVRLALLVALGLTACSEDSRDTGDTTPVTVTGVTGVTGNPQTGATGTGTTGADDTGTPTTGGGETGEATMAPVGTTAVDSDGGSSGFMTSTTVDPVTGTTGELPPPTGDYAAQYIAGDPARLSVRKADAITDTCVTLTFLAPADSSPLEYDVTLPMSWHVQGALIHQGAADCLAFAGFPGEPVMALSGNGSGAWAAGCPATLDLDVLLAFPQDQAWLPAEVLLQDAAVPVTGC